MNWQHFTLILWLRWRLSYNQWRRAGKLNAVLTMMLVISAVVAACLAFFITVVTGVLTLSRAEPDHMMLIWDFIVVAFLFLWSMGVMTELQRSEFLSLEKMLHYPVSPRGAFLLNYLSSLISLAIVLFVPSMIGLCLASVVTHGPVMLLLFPLVFGFLLAVSALTYQFRGWMATLMEDKRRRRTIITVVTITFILLTQIPNLANLAFQQQRREKRQAEAKARAAERKKLEAEDVSSEEHHRRRQQLDEKEKADKKSEVQRQYEMIVGYVAQGNLFIPAGWLPIGAREASKGNPIPGLLGSMGLILIGAASLWRSYIVTMRIYTGQINSSKPRQSAKTKNPAAQVTSAPLLERTLWGCSEHVSVVAIAGWRSMTRAPEAKMALLSPVIISAIFGSMILFGPGKDMPAAGYPFLAIGVVAMTMFGVMQLMNNVFGNDRGGFRAFVLMPIDRRDILLGKNLVMVPFGCALAAIGMASIQIVAPLQLMHVVATMLQLVPAYLLIALLGNMSSIYAPMAVSAGSLKPVQPKLWPMVVQMVTLMLMPMALIPAVLALVVEVLMDTFWEGRWFPLYLLITVIEFPLAIWLYRRLLTWQGTLLQAREAKILEVVSGKVE